MVFAGVADGGSLLSRDVAVGVGVISRGVGTGGALGPLEEEVFPAPAFAALLIFLFDATKPFGEGVGRGDCATPATGVRVGLGGVGIEEGVFSGVADAVEFPFERAGDSLRAASSSFW